MIEPRLSNKPLLFDHEGKVQLTYGSLWSDGGGHRNKPVAIVPGSLADSLQALGRVFSGSGGLIFLLESSKGPDVLPKVAAPLPFQELVSDGRDWLDRVARAEIGFQTSGTTGPPRLYVHRVEALARGVRSGPSHSGDFWLSGYHPAHIAAVQVVFQAVANDNPMVDAFRLSPVQVAGCLDCVPVTHLSATPTWFRQLENLDRSFPSVRGVTMGGEAYDPGLVHRLKRLFPKARFRNVYATTEFGSLLVSDGDLLRVPAALRDQVRVRDGFLEVRRELWAKSEELNQSSDEWIPTGDRAEYEEVPGEGSLVRIRGRGRDFVKVGGERVSVEKVERVLGTLPGLKEARVWARPNSVLGAVLQAEVVRDPQAETKLANEAEIRIRLKEILPPWEIPGKIDFTDQLDRTPTLKLRRRRAAGQEGE